MKHSSKTINGVSGLVRPTKTVLAAIFLLSTLVWTGCSSPNRTSTLPITVEQPSVGAPMTFGIPFPMGALNSPDHVRVLNSRGVEIPSQITEVTTWAPADNSTKWIWVFFFSEESANYTLEYGPSVKRAAIDDEHRITVVNNMRAGGYLMLSTGPLRLKVGKDGNGFVDRVDLDLDGDGFTDDDIIALGPEKRGSFLDILDAAGIDKSKATIDRNWIERGSGPLHMIIKSEGRYLYSREDNNTSPFEVYIHVYAGKSFMRVLHTLTYTGEPDKHNPFEGEHALVATQGENIVNEEDLMEDPGWTEPNDQIAAAGLSLDYHLNGNLKYLTAYQDGEWWDKGESQYYNVDVAANESLALFQTGPKPNRLPPVPTSDLEDRIDGFVATISSNAEVKKEVARADGWADVTGEKWGITVGMRNFIEEYPNEIVLNSGDTTLTAYMWSPEAGPMSFTRLNSGNDGGMVDNFAQGMTKTTELVYNFHDASDEQDQLERTMNYFLDPPIAHAAPDWYASTLAYGTMAPQSTKYAEFERGLEYKFQWMNFNERWEPWYGMFDYGDRQTYFYNDQWIFWNNNEPGQDYMRWLHFMRTGNRDMYLSAEAASRHSMDVDNIHWPVDPKYVGDSNYSLDVWEEARKPAGTPYLGMGARESRLHWGSLYSAHVWNMGWVANYYIGAYHRGLDVARLTADTYIKRIWGEHDLRGRRLYLSVWNLSEVYDATKDPRYLVELDDRVQTMLDLQQPQGGSLVLDRYGYAQVYVSHGLYRYLQMTGDERVKNALIKHARWVRDVPPRNHGQESFLSTIHSLLLGYDLSGEESLYREAWNRSQSLVTDKLPADVKFDGSSTQGELFDALEAVSHLPGPSNLYTRMDNVRRPNWSITQGSRIFGWTHAYNVPYLLYILERDGVPK